MADRSHRLFEIIQILRGATAPLPARALAEALEVSKRTIYRDVVTLQATGVPIEGAAGVGYVMRSGYDLPPLMFTADEIEAIVVGLSLLGRTGDTGLQVSATRVSQKISDVLPQGGEGAIATAPLVVSHWTAVPPSAVNPRFLRRAIREEATLRLRYRDVDAQETLRSVRPLALVYYVDSAVLAAWCELREDFRHFRLDRMAACDLLGENFKSDGTRLRREWRLRHESA